MCAADGGRGAEMKKKIKESDLISLVVKAVII